MSGNAFDAFLSTPAMLAVFDAPAIVGAMLEFEAALARAQADEGVIPTAAAQVIAAHCRPGDHDAAAIVQAAGRAGSLAIPLVCELRRRVAAADAAQARWVHWGSTSQDAIDTAMALATKQALALVQADLGRLIASLLALAEREAATPLLARTLMQPASATTLGFKLAGWVAPLIRARSRLSRAAAQALQLQFGGAVGTLDVLGAQGPAVALRLAGLLGLRVPEAAWHTQRDEWLALACEVGLLVGSLGKIAGDLALLSQAEVGELSEPSEPGRGGSTAMPHKRNPVASMVALAAAQRAPQRVAALLAAMGQQHERGLGNWQGELAEWAGLWISAGGSVAALAHAAPGLVVDRGRMQAHLDAHRASFDSDAALRVARERTGPWLAALRRQSLAGE